VHLTGGRGQQLRDVGLVSDSMCVFCADGVLWLAQHILVLPWTASVGFLVAAPCPLSAAHPRWPLIVHLTGGRGQQLRDIGLVWGGTRCAVQYKNCADMYVALPSKPAQHHCNVDQLLHLTL
jgi:hypothetical protein